MKTQASKRTRAPQTPRPTTNCGHCGAPRTTVQLGELAVFARRYPTLGLDQFIAQLYQVNTPATPVFVCTGCLCMTTDPSPHRH